MVAWLGSAKDTSQEDNFCVNKKLQENPTARQTAVRNIAERASSGPAHPPSYRPAYLGDQHGQARFPHGTTSSSSSVARHEYRVGQYVVDLASFEQLVLPLLRHADHDSSGVKKVCVIDEIGKMELFSQSFTQAVCQILNGSGNVIFGTIPVPKGKPLGLVEEIRNRKEVTVFSITRENRDSVLQDVVTAVQSCLKRRVS
ncbi:cancer-related nucleoside-triphosphatase [Sphaerodactylus townsendi]|uniref:cancer-related nucleoside-triphosphatase n=1 Tax=Sphaerodactylus townsendi TaxID=933632 RepID=UPI0020275894|nr:cancer-related nucleoside-triphosphatase [Sphaerodactylus townsendi]